MQSIWRGGVANHATGRVSLHGAGAMCHARHDILGYMRLNFSFGNLSGVSNYVRFKGLFTVVLCSAMLSPLVAHSLAINDTEGVWRGVVTCGELQVASSRSGKAFVSPVEVGVSLGAMTGKYENAQVIEQFAGSIDRMGRASVEGNGHWKSDPKRSWRYRLQGTLNGAQMTLNGPMESQDGKTKLRDCQLKLAYATPERKQPPALPKPTTARSNTAVNPVPTTESTARTHEKLNKDKELSALQAEQKQLEAERAAATKRRSDEEASAAAKAHAAEMNALRVKNLQLESERVAAEKAAAEKAAAERSAAEKAATDKASAQKAPADTKKAPIKVRSAMDL